MRFEVGVLGGGVVGLACAWRLAQGGARVSLYEAARTGQAASHAAGGMLAAQSEHAAHSPTPRASGASPSAFLQASLQSRALYPGFARELLEASGIDIELSQKGAPTSDWREPGILFLADHDDEPERLQVLAALEEQSRAGLRVQEREPSGASRVFWLGDEGQVENRLLARALRVACVREGVSIFEGCEATRRGGEWLVGGEPLDASQVLVCGGAWSGLLWPGLSRPLAGQMLVLDGGRVVESVRYGSRAYLIPRRDGRLLVGATQEERGFEPKATESGARELLQAALEMEPRLSECALLDHWAGLRPASPDGLPSLGRLDERSWCATGHGRNGILLCPWTAQVLAGAILRSSELPREFDPSRFAK